jgi:hypothetical protein
MSLIFMHSRCKKVVLHSHHKFTIDVYDFKISYDKSQMFLAI